MGNQDEIQSIFSPRSTCRSTASSSCAEPCRESTPAYSPTALASSLRTMCRTPSTSCHLSAHALEMLRAMRESSAKMGIGAVPAVTIHSEKGPITFFHQKICACSCCTRTGIHPGVREKLQQVIDALGKANLPKPLRRRIPRPSKGELNFTPYR